jgi:hypothetical protein
MFYKPVQVASQSAAINDFLPACLAKNSLKRGFFGSRLPIEYKFTAQKRFPWVKFASDKSKKLDV